MPKYFQDNSTVVAAMSTKKDGNMGFSYGDGASVAQNRETYLKTLGLDAANLCLVTQPHGSKVIVVDAASRGSGALTPPTVVAEGMVTQTPGVILGCTTADCIPVFFYHETSGTIGLAHAGWRSVVQNVVPNTLALMQTAFGCDPEGISVQMGAHICKNCFEIKDDVIPRFARYPERLLGNGGKLTVDLAGIVTDQLLQAGVQSGTISIESTCTMCSTDYYSYRRAGSQLEGLQLSVFTLL